MGFEPIRENEDTFFKNNKVATPARVTSFNALGGKQQPTIEKDYMTGDPGMGKQTDDRDPDLVTYEPNSYQLS